MSAVAAHGTSPRSLLGTFGRWRSRSHVTRLNTADGKTTECYEGNSAIIYKQACRLGCEGTVSKHNRSGRVHHCLKRRCAS